MEKKNKVNASRKPKRKDAIKDNDFKNLNEYFEKIKSKEHSKSKLNQDVIDEIKEVKKDNEVCMLEYNEETNPFGKKWSDICIEIKEKSPYRKFESYSVILTILFRSSLLLLKLMTT
jgi:hypothetical protein